MNSASAMFSLESSFFDTPALSPHRLTVQLYFGLYLKVLPLKVMDVALSLSPSSGLPMTPSALPPNIWKV